MIIVHFVFKAENLGTRVHIMSVSIFLSFNLSSRTVYNLCTPPVASLDKYPI